MRGEWQQAIEAIERSVAIAKERRTAVEGDAVRLAVLGESYLGLGDAERARALGQGGPRDRAGAGRRPSTRSTASRALARVLLGSAGPRLRRDRGGARARARARARDTGARADEPLVHVELAELARQRGDEESALRELREAHRLFTEIGATGHAERLAVELAAAPG